MFCRLYFPLLVWCTNGGAYKHAIMLAHPSTLAAYNGGTSVGHGPAGILFLSLILFSVVAHWMLAMALSGLFSWAWFCVYCQ